MPSLQKNREWEVVYSVNFILFYSNSILVLISKFRLYDVRWVLIIFTLKVGIHKEEPNAFTNVMKLKKIQKTCFLWLHKTCCSWQSPTWLHHGQSVGNPAWSVLLLLAEPEVTGDERRECFSYPNPEKDYNEILRVLSLNSDSSLKSFGIESQVSECVT